eukprot:TRINITY_DN9934_c0_g1_i1.p1 TRINITY_DN9934_c0_g1~~TRINITY_DN9934_c0_g1_i1.p1  ORF type:complete len:480 (-),score=56.78 TRINITY_DN9934_c0_g1_i1:162-1601(-)
MSEKQDIDYSFACGDLRSLEKETPYSLSIFNLLDQYYRIGDEQHYDYEETNDCDWSKSFRQWYYNSIFQFSPVVGPFKNRLFTFLFYNATQIVSWPPLSPTVKFDSYFTSAQGSERKFVTDAIKISYGSYGSYGEIRKSKTVVEEDSEQSKILNHFMKETNTSAIPSLFHLCYGKIVTHLHRFPKSALESLPDLDYKLKLISTDHIQVLVQLWPINISLKITVHSSTPFIEFQQILKARLKRRRIETRGSKILNNIGPIDYEFMTAKEFQNGLDMFLKEKSLKENIKLIIILNDLRSSISVLKVKKSTTIKELIKTIRDFYQLNTSSIIDLYYSRNQRRFYELTISAMEFFSEMIDENLSPNPFDYVSINEQIMIKTLSDLEFENCQVLEVFEVTGPILPVMKSTMVGSPEFLLINPDWEAHCLTRYAWIKLIDCGDNCRMGFRNVDNLAKLSQVLDEEYFTDWRKKIKQKGSYIVLTS